MKLSTGAIFQLVGEIGAILTQTGVLDANGDFAVPASPVNIAKASSAIEQLLVSEGVAVQGEVDKIIQVLPVIFSLAGLK